MRRSVILVVAIAALLSVSAALAADHRQIVSRISRRPIHSTALATIGYSKRLRALEVEFVNGAIYRYTNVPPEIYRALIAAPSKAQFYDENVRGHFPSVHVKPPRD